MPSVFRKRALHICRYAYIYIYTYIYTYIHIYIFIVFQNMISLLSIGILNPFILYDAYHILEKNSSYVYICVLQLSDFHASYIYNKTL